MKGTTLVLILALVAVSALALWYYLSHRDSNTVPDEDHGPDNNTSALSFSMGKSGSYGTQEQG